MARSRKKGAVQAEAPPEENKDVGVKPQPEENLEARATPQAEKNLDAGARPQALNAEHEKMLEWLKTVKFKRAMVGGVDEADVWRRLDELNSLYEAALIAERARYDLQLEEYAEAASEKLEKYRSALKTTKVEYEKLAAWVRQHQGGEGRDDE